MIEFEKNKIPLYILMFISVLIVSDLGNRLNKYFDKNKKNDEYGLIRKHLLNDPYGFDKPNLWIHSKYEKNARVWKSFYSRNSTDLNQPYIHLTVKTIIDHCGDDFNICLIDDDSFSKLIPQWNIDIEKLVEPMKSHAREYGMTSLLYTYGGIIVPNSFICLRNLKDLYEKGILNEKAFICEKNNRSENHSKNSKKLLFIPDMTFMGAKKENPTIREMLGYLKDRNKNSHFSIENEFLGNISQWCINKINLDKMTLISGELIGVKTSSKKTILLEDLMEDNFLNLHNLCFGIYIPNDEILKRNKYQWFASLPSEDVLKTSSIISKYLKASIVDTYNINDSMVPSKYAF